LYKNESVKIVLSAGLTVYRSCSSQRG